MKKLISLVFMVLFALCFSVTAFAGSVAGLCGAYNNGENVEWSLVLEEGTLRIKGGGEMADFSEENPAPWYNYREFIKKVEYEGEIERIGNYAFKDCSNITGTITFPENLHYIGDHAYENCTGFTGDLIIPASYSIGKAAFKNCTGFSGDLIIKSCHDLIDDEAFMNCTGFKGELILGIALNNGSDRIGARAFMNCTGFEKEAIVPHGVKNIGNNAFTNCGVDSFFFYSGPPELEEGYETNPPFDPETDTIYRFSESAHWKRGEGKPWYGYNLQENTRDIASGICGGYDGFNLTWRIDCSETLIISGEGKMGSYLPKEGEYAPWYKYIVRGLIVEEGVTTIGDGAFYGLGNLREVSLPSTLEIIGNNAFENCRNISESIVIPENVRSIGHYAFHNCKKLSGTLVLPESLEFIGAGAFQNCESLSTAVVFPERLREISYDAFLGCGINDFYFLHLINEPVIQAASSERPSFDSWDMLHFGQGFPIDNNQWNGYYADNTYADAVIDSGNCGAEGEQIDVQWELTASGKLTIRGTGRMRDYEKAWSDYPYGWGCNAPWYKYCRQITAIEIEDGIEYIGNYAFYNLNKAASKMEIPEGVTGIGSHAFDGCNSLYGELDIPISVTSIGEYAFGACWKLTGNLIIPSSVETVGKGAFTGCRGFGGILYISELLETINAETFYGCYNLTGKLVIPEGVKTIGEAAFKSCKKLSGDLIIPDSVETIEERAFEDCCGLDGELKIGSGVKTIGDSAFRYCTRLTGDIVIPDSVTFVYSSAFSYCQSFDGKIIIGSGILRIGEYLFRDCELAEKEVYIPANIKEISCSAFNNCGGKYYTFEWDPPSVYNAEDDYASFDAEFDRIIYPEDNTNWNLEDGKWNGYTVGRGTSITVFGDSDGNGKVDVMDAYFARLVAAKLAKPTAEQLAFCDVDSDGKITAIDANIIRKYAIGIIKELPVK